MKFNKPINREIEFDGNTFVVTMDESGVSFRVKGKRKSSRAEWPAILLIAHGEGVESGHHQSSQTGEPEEPEAPDSISRSVSAGDPRSES